MTLCPSSCASLSLFGPQCIQLCEGGAESDLHDDAGLEGRHNYLARRRTQEELVYVTSYGVCPLEDGG